jgi:drug/metabolite transporter (DMT)-like permease
MSTGADFPVRAHVNAPVRKSVLLGTLGVSVLAISTAAPLLVRAGAPPAIASLWRMLFAGVVLGAFVLARNPASIKLLTRADLVRLFVVGNLLGLHYLFWIGSLSHTSVISSTVLVTTNPLWVGLGAWLVLREPPARATWIAIAIGIAGAILLGLADANADATTGQHESLLGDAMALGGALAGSATLVAGRSLRARIGAPLFQSTICLAAVPIILVAAVFDHEPFAPVSANQALLLLAIAVIPQLIGNTILSWSLGHLSAPRVSLVILGEPIGASLLAWAFLAQTPKLAAIPGAMLVLIAVVMGARGGEEAAEDGSQKT